MAKIAFTYNVKHNNPSLDVATQYDGDFDLPETIDSIVHAIESVGHKVIRIEADKNCFAKLKKNKDDIDLVFNIAEGLYGDARESQIPLFCEILKIPYTHSSPTTNAIKMNKGFAKLFVKGAGILVPESFIVTYENRELPKRVKFPVLIKPNAEGSSVGIFNDNVVHDVKSLKDRLDFLYSDGFKGELLVEKYIDGREFTVAVLGNNPPKVLPIIEQRFDFLPEGFNNIAGYELKWVYEDRLKNLHDAYFCPAKLSKRLENKLKKVTLKIYSIMEVRDCARIDYRLSADGKLYFLEINTLPAINFDKKVISYFPTAARAAGLDTKDIVSRIIKSACERYNIDL